jgi:hypothetical protein
MADLRTARPEDAVFVMIATHGFTDASGEFYLVPSDGSPERPRETCVSSAELAAVPTDVDAGSITLILDTCQAAAIVEQEGFRPGPGNDRRFGQLAWDKRMSVLLACQKAGLAHEGGAGIAHGFLTHALVERGLLQGPAIRRSPEGDTVVELADLLAWARDEVPRLATDPAVRIVEQRGMERKDIDPRARAKSVQQPILFDFNPDSESLVVRRIR